MLQLQNVAIGFDNLIGVARSQGNQVGDGSQGGQMLNGLVSWAVLAVSHGVVCKNENTGQLHQGGKSDRRADIIAEYEEGRTKWPQLRKRHAIYDGTHRMFPDTEMQVSAAGS